MFWIAGMHEKGGGGVCVCVFSYHSNKWKQARIYQFSVGQNIMDIKKPNEHQIACLLTLKLNTDRMHGLVVCVLFPFEIQ